MRFLCAPALLLLVATACDKPEPAKVEAEAAASAAPSTAAAPSAEPAASAAAKPSGRSVDTPAGIASEVGDEIKLAGKALYPPPDCPAGGKDGCVKVKALRASMEGIKLLRHFDGPAGPKSILLFQVTTAGNACNGGPLFFVRVAKDAAPSYSDVFDHCGGPDPMVGAMPDKILINVPAHPPNKGAGVIPAKNMEYDIATGTLQTAPPATPKKKR